MRRLVLFAVFAWVVCPLQLTAGEPAAETPASAASTAEPDKAAATANTKAATSAEGTASAPASTGGGSGQAGRVQAAPWLQEGEARRAWISTSRRDVESGSRFTHKTCYTQADLEFVIERNKNASDELIRATKVCANASTCASN